MRPGCKCSPGIRRVRGLPSGNGTGLDRRGHTNGQSLHGAAYERGSLELIRATALALLLCAAACDSAPDPAPPPEASEDELTRALSAIGYVSGADPATGSPTGVTHHDPKRARQGLNLLTSGHAPTAVLVDMQGEVLHEWRAEFRDLFPVHPRLSGGGAPRNNFWRVARLLPDGDLIVIWDLYGIFKLDRESRVVWAVPERAHHDLHVTADGRIHHLEALRTWMPEIPEQRATEDYIVVRDPSGAELHRVAISAAMRNASWPELREVFWLRNTARGYGLKERARFDPFHTNALRILSTEDADRLGEPFEAGDALVSMAMLDTIAVIDPVSGRARWWWQGPFGMQHHPRVTPDGGIVLFNNHAASGRSSVQILDPRLRRVTWRYRGPETEPLYSLRSSGAEILANGNVLIVETDRGRALEVTPDFDVVWEFRTPYRAGPDGDRIAHLYSLQRLPRSSATWLPQ